MTAMILVAIVSYATEKLIVDTIEKRAPESWRSSIHSYGNATMTRAASPPARRYSGPAFGPRSQAFGG
jgi:hypothetical protein